MPLKALVTGSAGFLGRHFSAALRARGYTVDGWDTANGLDALGYFRDSLSWVRGDRVDLVVHAAAQGAHRAAIDSDPSSHFYNRMLDAALFDWALWRRPARVLYLSSCAVLDETPDDYGLTKLAGERMAGLARRAGVPVTVVRPYSGYGEDQSEDFPFGAFVARARRREDPFVLWNAAAVRDWIHVDDLVAAALAVVDADVTDPVSLCTGVGTSCEAVAAMCADAAGYQPQFQPLPGAPAGVDRRVGDPTLMLKFYTPKISLAEGVNRALS